MFGLLLFSISLNFSIIKIFITIVSSWPYQILVIRALSNPKTLIRIWRDLKLNTSTPPIFFFSYQNLVLLASSSFRQQTKHIIQN